MRLIFSLAYLLALVVPGGCIYPPDTNLDSYNIAVEYRAAFESWYPVPEDCDAYWKVTSVVFVDLEDVRDSCDLGDVQACYLWTPFEKDGIIILPYNYEVAENFVHELTHLLLRCTDEGADSDHIHEVWSRTDAWAAQYVRHWSAIDAIEGGDAWLLTNTK